MSKLDFEVKKPAAILEGGRRDGWGYYVEDLLQLERIGLRVGPRLPYRRTERRARHPHAVPEVTSEVWEYVPAWDPFLPLLMDDPSKLEVAFGAVAMCGRRGGQLAQVHANLPEPWGPGLGPLIFWLVKTGRVEQSAHALDPYYRIVRAPEPEEDEEP